MAAVFGTPSNGAPRIVPGRYTNLVLGASAASLVMLLSVLLVARNFSLAAVSITAIVAAASARYLRALRTDIGDQAGIAELLAQLPDDYAVFHDLRLMRSGVRQSAGVDHIVVGPTGVFVIDAKSRSDNHASSSAKKRRLSEAIWRVEHYATDLRGVIKAWSGELFTGLPVTPIIVFGGPPQVVHDSHEDSVKVLGADLLLDEICGTTQGVISPGQATRLARALVVHIPQLERSRFVGELSKLPSPGEPAPEHA